jgi:hypothetical protein
MPIRSTLVLLFLAFCVSLQAQEIKYIDLSVVQQRTELRHPPVLSPNGSNGTHGVGAGYGGGSVFDGAPDRRDPHALGAYLLQATPTDINPEEPFEAEFRVLNTGLSPIEIPVSAHLSDLQPSDESLSFSYISLAVIAHLEDGGPFAASVELYGSPEQEGTMLVLRPGEWIRVAAKLKFRTWPSEPVSTHLRGDFLLRRNTFYPHPGGEFREVRNLYPNVTPTPGIPVRFVRRPPSAPSAQSSEP